MNTPLTPFWSEWQGKRLAQATAAGCPPDAAERLSSREARTRMAAAKLVGRKAALECEVITEYRSDGTLGVYAQVDRSLIPYKFLQRAERWANFGSPQADAE